VEDCRLLGCLAGDADLHPFAENISRMSAPLHFLLAKFPNLVLAVHADLIAKERGWLLALLFQIQTTRHACISSKSL
jgi:hypothetical protein